MCDFKKLHFCPIFLALLLGACISSSAKMNRVELGMSSDEVVSILGEPTSKSALNDDMILHYLFRVDGTNFLTGEQRSFYFVLLESDRVVQFGAGRKKLD